MYQTFEHTADLGMLVEAADRNSLFAEAGRAFLSILVENPDAVRPETQVEIQVAGNEPDYLLLDWLNELLYRFERDRLLLCDFEVAVDAEGLHATARGEPLDRVRHHLSHEVKAVTYHQLEVKQTDAGWRACFIVDI